MNNVVFEYNSCVGGRYNGFYAEGEQITGIASTGGSLTTSTTYYTQPAFGLSGTLGVSEVPTSTDGAALGAQGNALAIAANTAILFELPCDFLHWTWLYIDTQNTAALAHLGDVAAFTATSSGANLTLSGTGTLAPPAAGGTFSSSAKNSMLGITHSATCAPFGHCSGGRWIIGE